METITQTEPKRVLDLLGGRLTFERNGVKLYDRVIQKIETGGERRYQRLLGQLRRIRDEEQEHAEWLEKCVRTLGGDAYATTAMGRLESEESRGFEGVIMNGHVQVLHLLHALLAAELVDNAGWDLLARFADETGDREARRGIMRRMAEEARHLAFLREAVVKAAKLEIMGRKARMPARMRGAILLTRPRRRGLGALLVAAGAVLAASLFIRRPELVKQSRRLLRVA